MATPKQIIDIFSKFDAITAFESAMSIDDNARKVLNLNRSQLRNEGILSTGKRISPLYIPRTQIKKKRMGSKTTPVPDLYATGDMQDGLEIVKTGHGEYRLDSPVPYTKYVKKNYTDNIFGIAPKNIKSASSILLPDINKNIKTQLKL